MTDFKEFKIWQFDTESERIEHIELYLPASFCDEVEELTREAACVKRAESDDKKNAAVPAWRIAFPGFDTPNLKLIKHDVHLDARSQIEAYESAYLSAPGGGRNHLEDCDLHRALDEDSSNERAGYHLH